MVGSYNTSTWNKTAPRASRLSERHSCDDFRPRRALEWQHGMQRPSVTSHTSLLTRWTRSMLAQGKPLTFSFRPVVLELIDNDGADDDAAFDDLLPVSGNVGQIEDVIQYADDESANDSTCYRADTTG